MFLINNYLEENTPDIILLNELRIYKKDSFKNINT